MHHLWYLIIYLCGFTAAPTDQSHLWYLMMTDWTELFHELLLLQDKEDFPSENTDFILKNDFSIQSELCLFCLVMNCTDTKRQTNSYTREERCACCGRYHFPAILSFFVWLKLEKQRKQDSQDRFHSFGPTQMWRFCRGKPSASVSPQRLKKKPACSHFAFSQG